MIRSAAGSSPRGPLRPFDQPEVPGLGLFPQTPVLELGRVAQAVQIEMQTA